MVRSVRAVLFLALLLFPAAAFAQVGNIAGTVRDSQGGVLPGVTVEVTSPQLIEKVRSTVTDGNGRYQIAGLPVGTYKITFKLERFATVERANIELTSDFTAPINADMKLGTTQEVVTVQGSLAPLVDVQNVRQRQVITGEELRDLPTTRDLTSLVNLVPGISIGSSGGVGNVQTICSGGAGGFVDSIFGSAFSFTTSGALSGCTPILNGFNAHSSMNDGNSLNQGRIQVDGLGVQSFAGGGRSSYLPDVGNAQEVTFTLSGSLGESETGGATINIVPRTGGNRYTGNFFTTYSNGSFYDRNNGTRRGSFLNLLEYNYEVNGSYGGPVKRDRLWFFVSPRQRARSNLLTDAYPNANEGIFGANYKSDTTKDNLGSTELYKNVSLRMTYQATQKNKLNIFWDEQYTCENPCKGITTAWTSPEAQGTSISQPLHLAQLSWTNPLSNKILLDAGASWYSSHYDQTTNRFWPTYPSIPKVNESGVTVQQANPIYTLSTTGSINNATYFNNDNWQTRMSAAYVSGSHNVKLGYQGGYLANNSRPHMNDMRMEYAYTTPAAQGSCVTTACVNFAKTLDPSATSLATGCYNATSPLATPPQQLNALNTPVARPWCGSINLVGNPNNLNDPLNTRLLPVPTSFTMFIPNERKESVWFTALYLQDQWTLNRFTLNGALRYDNSRSKYGKTCQNTDRFTPNEFCVNDPANADPNKRGTGVNFQDITPRFSVAWDAFGNGKTALKFSLGKYLNGAGVGGVYTASNVAGAGRAVNSFTRGWTDLDGDRIVDCDLTIPSVAPSGSVTSIPANGECAAITSTTNSSLANYRRFGRSPDELDEANLTIGLGEIQCGRADSSRIPAAATPYCDAYAAAGGGTLLNGWNKRTYEWQMSVGLQHEVLPRMSVEVTYNRRSTKNQILSDDVGVGCDLYGPTSNDPNACMSRQLNFQSEWYDFYAIQAPVDPRLPNGGGYLIPGFANRKPGVTIPSTNQVTVQTLDIDNRIIDYWRGVDVNVTLRARGGVRISGGTSTGSRYVNNCAVLIDQADITGTGAGSGVILRQPGNMRNCAPDRPFQTNVRGTASYTIPWVDVLFSGVFSYRPGAQIAANYTVNVSDLRWLEGSEYRAFYAGTDCNNAQGVPTTGCLTGTGGAQTVSQNLMGFDSYGEGIRLFDIKLAKNIRFAGRRLNVGMDIYNAFNSDAGTSYCTTYPICGTVAAGTDRPWKTIQGMTSPRYAQFTVQFDF